MSNIGNRETMAKNLKYYLNKTGRTQKEASEVVGVAASTFNDWMKAKKYPRIDKIEILADYFGVMKSDLIEEKVQKNNDVIVDIVTKLRVDEAYLSVCKVLADFTPEELNAALKMLDTLQAFKK